MITAPLGRVRPSLPYNGLEGVMSRAFGNNWIADPNRWMFGATRARLNNSTSSGTGATSAGFESQAAKVIMGLPAYPVTHIRLVFTNWRRNTGGGTPIEVLPGNTLTIDECYIHIAGTAFQVLFSGSGTTTLADGATIIADALDITSLSAANRTNALANVCTLTTVATNGVRVAQGSDRVMTTLGEGIQHAATPGALAGLCAANTVSGGGSGGHVFPFGPAAALVRGWDGRPTVMLWGDSILFGQNSSSSNVYFGHTARGCGSFGERGLDDEATTRLPFANFAVPGVDSTQSDALIDHPRTCAIIDDARALNTGSALPFTCFFGNMGTNDFGAAVQATIYPTPFLTDLGAHINFLKGRYPGARWIHNTLWPRTTTSPSGEWGVPASQTPVNTDATAGNGRWLFNTALVNGTTGLAIDGVINTVPVVQDATLTDRWKTGPRAGTLSAAYTTPATTFQSATAFEVGDSVSINNAGTMINRIVTARTGTGPFTHTISTNFGVNLSSGTAIATRMTDDGVHPWVTAHIAMGAIVAANKNLFT